MDYNALKVTDLKGLLKERGIASTGLTRKQQIIEALESSDANEEGKNDAEEEGSGVAEGAGEEVGRAAGLGESEAAAAESVPEAEPRSEEQQDASDSPQQKAEVTAEAAALDDVAAQSTEKQAPPARDNLPTGPLAQASASTQPTVLESNDPVSKEPSALVTPRETSPVGERTSSDRKRKRRSPTPPISQETVNKKLKAAEEDPVTLPEDEHAEDATGDAPSMESEELPPVSDSLTAEQTHADGGGSSESVDALQVENGGTIQPADDASGAAPHSVHSPTRAIYIHNLVRPIQASQLQDHLEQLAAPPDKSAASDMVELLHLGSIRTHAFAIFTSKAAAVRARAGLHDQIWPDEPARKALWVDFVPEEKVQQWIERETEGGGGRRDTRRWEIVYDEDGDGVVARHQEVNPSTAPSIPDRRPSNISASVQGQGMPNAPLGPRGSRPSVSSVPPPKQATPNPTSSASFAVLDERFPSTTTKPKIYFLPVSKDLADRRLDELERQTSREWGARGADMGRDAEVRRYTFEDGDRLVDGGPHFGDFSGPRMGGGGRGRGGFRGRR